MRCVVLLLFLSLATAKVPSLHIVSPLSTFTIDKSGKSKQQKLSPRNRFLARFGVTTTPSPSNSTQSTTAVVDDCPYQFVGVVQSHSIQWHARRKPAYNNNNDNDSTWLVRLVHVDRAAVTQDLWKKGQIDVLAEYQNLGTVQNNTIRAQYYLRKKKISNLWNWSPSLTFAKSGHYHRERRLRPGWYTDGRTVYEATYRYRDGRNGLRRKSSLEQFWNATTVDDNLKIKLRQRLERSVPDVVLEE